MVDKGSFFNYAGITFLILAVVMSSLLFRAIAVHEDEDYIQAGDELDYEDFEDQDSIQICCAWGDEIEDGTLTYIIDEESSQIREAVYNSIEEWDAKIEGLTFEEVSNRRSANVEIDFREDGGHKAGETRNYFDGYGFLTKSSIIISKAAFGFGFNIHLLEQIIKHEIGHVLGLAHSTFDGSLMTRNVNPYVGSVSDCEINAVYKAQHWKLEENSSFPDYPEQEYVECSTKK
ncbi:MAG TPA: matrixin family metalloprotease [Nitrososphaeraceae archaeon]|nr:matrixin family metalloprotease [Nitrososphaeraceae archaeon]